MPNQPTMNFANNGSFNASSPILALTPLIYFGIAVFMAINFYPFYQRTTDPEYFHLLNGINVALFNLAAPYTDHPGTPLQLIVAMSSWPLGFFIPGSLADNVIDHPELFLKGAILTKNLIIALVLFITGRGVFAITKNIWLALLIQLLPFGSAYVMTVIGRLNPEGFIIAPVALLFLLLIRYLYNDTGENLSNKNIKHFALIGGLGMATKFSYLPFLLIPVFMLKSFRPFTRYGLLTIFFTLIFAFPILFNFTKTISWFGNMAVNSGNWGEGTSTFIEWGEVPHRFYQLLAFNKLFTLLLLVLGGLYIYSRCIKKNKTSGLIKLNLISAGVLIGIIFSVFLITKHFALRYYMPTLLFQLVVFYLIVEYSMRLFQFRMIKKYLPIIAFTFYLIIGIPRIPGFKKLIDNTALSHEKYAGWSNKVESARNEGIPLIISSFYAGCPFPEFSLNNGYLLCGHLKSTFSDRLREKYPESIIYVGWSEKFYHWNYFWDAGDFVDPGQGVYVFIGKDKKEDFKVILDRLDKAFPKYSPHPELLEHSDNFDESFYRVSFVSP